jgi:hypothetical protein
MVDLSCKDARYIVWFFHSLCGVWPLWSVEVLFVFYLQIFDKPTGSPFGDGYMMANMILQDKNIELTFHGILEWVDNRY